MYPCHVTLYYEGQKKTRQMLCFKWFCDCSIQNGGIKWIYESQIQIMLTKIQPTIEKENQIYIRTMATKAISFVIWLI